MGLEGRVMKELLTQAVDALNRSANATEKMLELASKETATLAEPGLPVCPHCGQLNPVVTQLGAGGSGPIADFVLMAETHCCNKTVYAVPLSFDTFVNKEMALAWLSEKGGKS